MSYRILVTGEGPWTIVGGGGPGSFIGEHISEVRPLCVAEALQQAGYDVSFLSRLGSSDDVGGFSFRCVGKEIAPDSFDIIVCHQSMFWYYEGFEDYQNHPNILVSGDMFPRKKDPQNIRWMFHDAPGHAELPSLVLRWPHAQIREGHFGVTSYQQLPDPFPDHSKPNIVYLGKLYEPRHAEILSALADTEEINVWFGGKIAGRHVQKSYDAALTDSERRAFFSDRVQFMSSRQDYHGPVSLMQAAAYCQHADLGLVFDPGIRSATVSKMYFYMSCGIPTLVLGGCSNAAHAEEIQAGVIVKTPCIPKMDGSVNTLVQVIKEQVVSPDRAGIQERALSRWGYGEIIKPWAKCWESGLE